MVRFFALALLAVLALLALSSGPQAQASPGGGARDTDGDGIPDAVEDTNAYRRLGGSHRHKDVWVECDFMQGRKPSPDLVRNLRTVFESAPLGNPDGRRGVELHLTIDDSFRFEKQWGNASSRDGTRALFQKAMARRRASLDGDAAYTRYCLFTNTVDPKGTVLSQSFDSTDGSTGGPGDMVVIALGGLKPVGGAPWQQTGVLLRALGFTFGLRDGGDDDIVYKPNYLSVMNRDHQFGFSRGREDRGAYETAVYVKAWDFSRYTLPDLNEARLNERAGVQIRGCDRPYVGFYACGSDLFYFRLNGPVDWNCNGRIQTAVKADINGDGKITRLNVQNDWENLAWDGGAIGGRGRPSAPVTPGSGQTRTPER